MSHEGLGLDPLALARCGRGANPRRPTLREGVADGAAVLHSRARQRARRRGSTAARAARLAGQYARPAAAPLAWPGGLTEREVEALRLIAKGHANRTIARQLHISDHRKAMPQEHMAHAGSSAREAEAAFRADFRKFPDNGWSLSGPQASLERQGKSAEAATVKARCEAAGPSANAQR